MKKMVMALTLLTSAYASANLISVEFRGCSTNENVLCANVYTDLTAHVDYRGQEMILDEIQDEALVNSIRRLILGHGQSLAVNIEGRVLTINKFGANRTYKKLQVDALSNRGPRPRGF